MGEDELLIDFDFVGDDFAQFEDLEERLAAMIGQAGVGKYEGNEFATDGSNGSLAMYGPDADALYAVARTLLAEATFLGTALMAHRLEKKRNPWDGLIDCSNALQSTIDSHCTLEDHSAAPGWFFRRHLISRQ
jgi:hypothetical protein